MIKFRHLEESGYSYFQHFKRSMKLAFRLHKLAICATIHAVYPGLLCQTVSRGVHDLDECLK